jgi:amino acid adenylation domain-containing protein
MLTDNQFSEPQETRKASMEENVLVLFQHQADAHPARVAISEGPLNITYAEINARSNRLARYLKKKGVEKNDFVAVCLPGGINQVTAALAVLKAGAAYVSIAPDYPLKRLIRMLEKINAPAFFAPDSLSDSFSKIALNHIQMDGPDAEYLNETDTNGDCVTADPEDIVYIIFTSGTTGEPRGVLTPHRGLSNLINWHQRVYQVTPEDRAALLASTGFDASIWELWPYLCAGACLCVPGKQVIYDPGKLVEWVDDQAITSLFLPTPMAELFLAEEYPDTFKLERLLTGGDRMLRGLTREIPFKYFNHYGQTENSVVTTFCEVKKSDPVDSLPPIGRPIDNVQCYVLDEKMKKVQPGESGELYISGQGLSKGYLRDSEETGRKFVVNPFEASGRSILFRSGDRVRRLSDGNLEFKGRADDQVKIRGNRIEPGEIEHALMACGDVRQAAVLVEKDPSGRDQLTGYIVSDSSQPELEKQVRNKIKEILPGYMVPAAIRKVESMPLTSSGKIDRKAIHEIRTITGRLAGAVVLPANEIELKLLDIWRKLLKQGKIGVNENFFDLGGHSMLLVDMYGEIDREFEHDLEIVELFDYSTIQKLASRLKLRGQVDMPVNQAPRTRPVNPTAGTKIAVISMTGRFPGASSVEAYWENIRNGVESIRFFSREEMIESSVPVSQVDDPNYVPARGLMDDPDKYDAAFFGYNPRDALLMDPQHRQLLECSWEVMERAGYDATKYPGRVGVFVGTGKNTYEQLAAAEYSVGQSLDLMQSLISSGVDFPSARISYNLNLHGPSMNIQTACSTSLVAVHVACRSLLEGECDLALAGGASIKPPLKVGSMYQPGGITSPDGHCRAFDAAAEGTVGATGVGVVLLKRLEDALDDGDAIEAVILGSAVNNDGSEKLGFSAPSIKWQADVIRTAHQKANIHPDTIQLVECHGTGTPLGDPVEIEALTRAFGKSGNRTEPCAIGSVKSNLGHLDAAAGVAGLIKTVMCLKHREMAPSLNYREPNPRIDFKNSPFRVNDRLCAWPRGAMPRRAGVSSFGIGGTNAHVVLEEAPDQIPITENKLVKLVILSARSRKALDRSAENLLQHLESNLGINLDDVAYTLQVGRRDFEYRLSLLCKDRHEAVDALRKHGDGVVYSRHETSQRPVVFMFPGQGSQHENMARGLYEQHEMFRAVIDDCCKKLLNVLNLDLRHLLFPEKGGGTDPCRNLEQTCFTQPALFVIDYALARLWIHWGIKPWSFIGHSLGEYVAACLAGVMSLEDALSLIAIRGRLMNDMLEGSMLSVCLPEDELKERLDPMCSVAAVNLGDVCTVSGPVDSIRQLEIKLRGENLKCQSLNTSHAFHSVMMEPCLEIFVEEVKKIQLDVPQIKFISNVTGSWITDAEAVDPDYWGRQLRETVRFSDGLATVFRDGGDLLLEAGAGKTLSSLAGAHPEKPDGVRIIRSLPCMGDGITDQGFITQSVAQFWLNGLMPNWSNFHPRRDRRRVQLPTYPFEHQSFWIKHGSRHHQVGRKPFPATLQENQQVDLDAADHPRPGEQSASGLPVCQPRPESDIPFVEARNKIESSLALIWQELLGIGPIGIDDNFFNMGGHSLSASRIMIFMREEYDIELPIRQIFDHPTIRQLARMINLEMDRDTDETVRPSPACD